MKKLTILFGLLLSFNVFADVKDGVAVLNDGGRRGRDRMVVGFITTYAISDYHH
jgi:hypothetical protein